MACDPDLTLRRALRLTGSEIVAFVGAGGKSAALFQLARQFERALLTTSTHLGGWQAGQADQSLEFNEEEIKRALAKGGICLVTGGLEADTGKLAALPPQKLARLKVIARQAGLPLLIEADGARGKALKAPAAREPAIPPFAEMVIVCAGLKGLGRPLDAETVHRPQIFGELSGLGAGELIGADHLARVLNHPQGGQKNIPPGARRVFLLNQADALTDLQLAAVARQFSAQRPPRQKRVLLTSLRQEKIYAVHEATAGIILAAGSASRFGAPKQILDFHGRPFVRKVAETALKAGLWPLIVVTGAYADQVEAALSGLPVQIIHNAGWQEGQAASIRAGVSAARAAQAGAALFLLADQPQVTVEVIRALVEHHAQRLDAVTAPYIFDQRANPVLFDAVTFDALAALSGENGGRAIFGQFSPRYLTWYDRRLLLDVDTPQAYQEMMNAEH